MVELTQTITIEEHPLDRIYRLQREDAIKYHKENTCPSCANYNSSACRDSFDNVGRCWFCNIKSS